MSSINPPIRSINPSTGKIIKSYRPMTPKAVDRGLREASAAFQSYKRLGFPARSALMKRVARLLRKNKTRYARLMALEMGKLLPQGAGEIEKCAWACEFYADNAAKFLSPLKVRTDARKSYVAFEPLGVLLAVMPWNFPFWQVIRAAAPALMAGNVFALKHAPNVPACAAALEKLFREAGYEAGCFKNFPVETPRVAYLIDHPAVKAVTLTGSVAAGRAVAGKAGLALKKTVLELGGSDPYVVLEDADLPLAVQACGSSRLINGGQSCVAAKRFIVVKPLHAEFVKQILDFMRPQTMDDPFQPGATIGPLARRDLRDGVHRQVKESIRKGAKLLLGGSVPDRKGFFYPPTVLSAVKTGMPAFDEEIFGPVASIIEARDERHALELANDTSFGLGAAIFTRDTGKGEKIARHSLNAGCVFVNTFVKSDPRLPFGGIEQSGFGRELGIFGIREFVNIKTVYVQ